MNSRRKFLQQSAAFALMSLILPNFNDPDSYGEGLFSPNKKKRPIGLQLYTLGNLMVTDPKGTLQKLAAIGYKELESASSEKGNFYGFAPKELASIIKDLGMHWRSAHIGGAPFSMEQVMRMAKNAEDSARIQRFAERMKNAPKALNLKENYQEVADKAAEGSIGYVVCSSIPVGTMDEIKTAVDVFNKAGEACKKNGIQFAYHNHTTEFDNVEGHRPFDYILSNTDKNLVKMQLDLAWATKAAQDPVELFKQHPGRFPLWHVKDLDRNTKNPTQVGNGYIDFKRIFDNAGKSGLKYFFIEQDGAKQPIEDVTTSYNNLKKIVA